MKHGQKPLGLVVIVSQALTLGSVLPQHSSRAWHSWIFASISAMSSGRSPHSYTKTQKISIETNIGVMQLIYDNR